MKKMIMPLVLLLLASAVTAQRPAEFGIKGGVNFSNLEIGSGDAEVKTGVHIGALAHVHLDKRFALQPEVVFSTQGAEYTASRKDKLYYVNIPLQLQYMFSNGLRIQTGPQLGILASAESENASNETNTDDAYKNADASWSFGAGYLARSGFGVDARYNLGLSDISKGPAEVKNRVWQLGLFYQFRK